MLPCLTQAHHAPGMQADAEKVLKFKPAARAIVAALGGSYSEAHVKAQLESCRLNGQMPVLWGHPDIAKLVAKTLDIRDLPDHPHWKSLLGLIAWFGDKVVVRLLHECANKRKDGSYLSGSADIFVEVFDTMAMELPPNAIPSWSYEPSVPIDFEKWKPQLAKVACIDLYGNDSVNAATAKGQRAVAFAKFAEDNDMPLIIGEAGDTNHKMLTDGQKPVIEFWKLLLLWGAQKKARLIAITNDPYGGEDFVDKDCSGRWAPGPGFPPTKVPAPPWWEGNQYVCAFLAKTLASPFYIKAQAHPAIAAGLVAA